MLSLNLGCKSNGEIVILIKIKRASRFVTSSPNVAREESNPLLNYFQAA